MTSIRRSPLAVLFLTVVIDLLGFGILIPLQQLYAKRFGATPFQVGLLFAVYSAMQLLFAPIWGRLSDRVGRRPILLVSIFGSAAAYALFAQANSLAVLFIARIFAGICGANISTAQAYVADVTDEKNRTRGMGMIGAAFGIGFVLGPALAGIVAGAFGPRAPFWVAFGLSVINFVSAALFLPESRPASLAPRRSRLESVLDALRKPELRSLLGIFFLVTFAFATLETAFALWLAEPPFFYQEKQVGLVFAYIGVLLVMTQGGLAGRLAKKLGEIALVRIGIALMCVGLLLLPIAHTRGVLLLILIPITCGNGLNNPALSALLSLRAPADRQGEILGVAQSVSALSRILAPLAAGWLFGALGSDSPYWAGGAIMGAAFLLTLSLLKPTPIQAIKTP